MVDYGQRGSNNDYIGDFVLFIYEAGLWEDVKFLHDKRVYNNNGWVGSIDDGH